MNKFLSFFLLVFSSEAALGQDIQAAADDACKCLEEPYVVLEKILGDVQVAQAHGDYSALLEKQGEMMGIMETASVCFEGLAEKYPEIDQSTELQTEVMDITEDQCPNPAEQFQFGK